MTTTFTYNPDQERDDVGRWSPSGEAAASALDAALGQGPVRAETAAQARTFDRRPTSAPTRPPRPLSDPSFNDFDLADLAARDRLGNGDEVLGEMWRIRGFDGKPTVVPKDEFERRVEAEGMTVVYRGIRADTQEQADAYAEQFRTGDKPYPGLGRAGNGTYATTSEKTASEYVAGTHAKDPGGGGALIRMAIPNDAKIEDSTVLRGVMMNGKAELDRPNFDEDVITKNMGRYATAKGVQALSWENPGGVDETFYSIQDRSMLVVEAAPTATFAFNPDQERDEKGRWVPSGDKAAGLLDGLAHPEALTGYKTDTAATQAAAAPDSMSAHLQPDGTFTAERAALHDQIVAKALEGVPSVDHPTHYMMGGGPASGKSTLLSDPALGIPQGKEAVLVAADNIKADLPEYNAMLAAKDPKAAEWVHEESSYLSKRVMADAVENNQPVVLDAMGDSSYDGLQAKVESLRSNGGRVVAHYAVVDPDVAMQRMVERGQRTGRYVPESVLRGAHASVAQILPQAMERGLYDEVTVWNTEGPRPTKIAEAQGTDITVHDQVAWDRFKAQGQ